MDRQQFKTELDTIHLINHCFHFIVVLQKTLSDSNETLFVEYSYCNHGDTGCSIIQPIVGQTLCEKIKKSIVLYQCFQN